MTTTKMAAAFLALALLVPAVARAQVQYSDPVPPLVPVTPPVYQPVPDAIRSEYYHNHPRADPEPFRCDYAADADCPGRRYSGFMGDPRDDPEPARCSYSKAAECGGDRSGAE